MNLDDAVTIITFIGPLQAKKLARLGIKTVRDLLHHYPFRYDDYSQIVKISELVFGQTVTVAGQIQKIDAVRTRAGKRLTKAKLVDETGSVDLIWFNQPYLAKTLKPETAVWLSGRVGEFSGKLTFISPDYELVPKIHTGRLVPVYPETQGLSSKWLRSRLDFLLASLKEIADYLPFSDRAAEGLIDLDRALRAVHFPRDADEVKTARERLTFDEMFLLQARAWRRREERQNRRANYQLTITNFHKKADQFMENLPFQLTGDQKQATMEILSDLTKEKPMNRLLQGDVGSGKTVVAAVASYATAAAGYKTLLMAPTEILANQHYQTFDRLFRNFDVKINLVTATTRQNRRFQIPNSKFEILIGTHALLYQLENDPQIGLVIVDEQHKFGVEQRAKLLKIGQQSHQLPHLLSLTATPIPRTLALTFLGDLDISTLSQMPAGRQKITTWFVAKEKREKAYAWIKKHLANGRSQAFVVCPFIEESETLKSVRAATVEFTKLQTIFYPLKIALLHGRLKSKEKEKIMGDFSQRKIDILVATPVVEVGLDNPNATIMLVEGAERFGLASLHQLRGRVGRGEKPSYCLLFTENETAAVVQRLKSLEKFSSGIKLAERDLKRRGGGEIFGTLQSGFPQTKLADLSDLNLIQRVNRRLQKIAQKQPDLIRGLVKNASLVAAN